MEPKNKAVPPDIRRKKRILALWFIGLTLAALMIACFNFYNVITESNYEGKITNIDKDHAGRYKKYSTIYLTSSGKRLNFSLTSDDTIKFSDLNFAISKLTIGDRISIIGYEASHGDLIAYEIDLHGEKIFQMKKEEAKTLAISSGDKKSKFWTDYFLIFYGAAVYVLALLYSLTVRKSRKSWSDTKFYNSIFTVILIIILPLTAIGLYLTWTIFSLSKTNAANVGYVFFTPFLLLVLCALFFAIRALLAMSEPVIILSESSVKYKTGKTSYAEIYYADIQRMSVLKIRSSTYIAFEKRDTSSANIDISLLNALPQDIFEYITKYRKDLGPIGGWDWSNVQSI